MSASDRQVFEEEARKEAEYDEMHRKRCEALPLAEGIWEFRIDEGPFSDGLIELCGNDAGIIIVETSDQLRQYAIDLLTLADMAEDAGF
jgi:hypothetical protein